MLSRAKARWPQMALCMSVFCGLLGQVPSNVSVWTGACEELVWPPASLRLGGNRKSSMDLAPLASSDLQRTRTANHPHNPRGSVGAHETWLCITKKSM